MELGVPEAVPALNAPSISYQLHHGFWVGAQARVAPRRAHYEAIQMSCTEGLAVMGTGGRQLNYPAGSVAPLQGCLKV